MNQEIHTPVSVLDPVGKAIDEVKVILFQPFDLKKWFIIGFCAWLAHLGSSGGPNANGSNFDFSQNNLPAAKEYIIGNLAWIVPVAGIAVITMILLWLVMTWLSSRGHFMFLHCVSKNAAEVKVPWSLYSAHGNNLFLFRFLLGIISTVVVLLSIVPGIICGVSLAKGFGGPIPIVGLIFGILVTISLIILFALIKKFTFDFVVPIMSLQTPSCVVGWRVLMGLLSKRKGAFVLYILFCILIAIVFGAIVMTAVLVTCCCAGIILAIPYIGIVLMLPLLVFKRAYSLHFLSQFGPDYDVFIGQAELVEPIDS